MNIPLAVVERFHARYEQIPEAGCWLWTGPLFADGRYGQTKVGKKTVLVHRLSWLLHRGEIPDGLCVLHRCDTPSCVNPEHLFLGTIADNNADRARKGRSFHPIGTLKTTAKLNDEKVAHLRSLPILRLSEAQKLAAEWGVSWRHLYRVRSGERWLQ